MKYTSELYILTEKLDAEYWNKLYKALMSHLGFMGKFELTYRCTDNVVRFFISSDRDLSALSSNIEGLLLRPVEEKEYKLPSATSSERMVQFVAGGNILDLKEKYTVRKGRELQYALISVRAINIEKAVVNTSLFFKDKAGAWSLAKKLTWFFPANLLAIDFTTNTRYLKKTVPKYLNIEKSLHLLANNNLDALFEVDTFPYFPHNYFLNITNYEFDKHSFIIGATGSGKSKFITLYVDRLYRTAMKMNYRVIIIDPHASLAKDMSYLKDSTVVNFSNESTELFAGSSADISASTELTSTLFKSLLGDQYNARLNRLLRFTLFVLFTAQNMSLDNLKRFLTDLDFRNQVIQHVSEYVPDNIVRFFGSDFNELKTQHYNEAIMPIVSLVDEMQLQPSLSGGGDISLVKTVKDSFLTIFSLNKVSMGDKTTKTIAGLLIQQIFLLAQSRAFGQKVILIIDEVSVVQNPALSSILAEARKFNLTVILTQQYFGQIEKDLRDAIFANVYNYYTFKVSEEDARALEGNLNIELPSEIIEQESAKGLKETDIRVKILTELNARECLIRLSANGQINPCLKARTVDAPYVDTEEIEGKEFELQEYKKQKTLPEQFKETMGQPALKTVEETEIDQAGDGSDVIDLEELKRAAKADTAIGATYAVSPEVKAESHGIVLSDDATQGVLDSILAKDEAEASAARRETAPSEQQYASNDPQHSAPQSASNIELVPYNPGSQQSEFPSSMSLMELLGQHSSSRIPINKRKE
jgi:hypothetical protein